MPKLSARIGKRHALEGAAAGVVALGLLLWWLLPLGDEPPSGSVTISTGNQAGVYYEYGRLLKGELSKDLPDLNVTLRASNGSQDNVARVAERKATFAIAAADAVDTYDRGHQGASNELRAVARLYDDYLQLVVPKDSPVMSVADLRGKRVGTGLEGSGVRLMANRVLAAAGVDPEKDITAMDEGIDSGPEHLKDGRIDAFFWSGGVPTKGLEKLFASSRAFRFVSIPADLVAKMHQDDEKTRFYRATNMPEDAYPEIQNGKTVPTVAVANLLITRVDTKTDLAEWMTKVVIKSRDEIGRHVHSAQLVDLRTAIYTDPLRLHDGARRYYRSVKL